MTPAQSVLIADADFTGHHLVYVRLIIEECARRGWRPIFSTSNGAETSDEWANNLSGIQHDFTIGPPLLGRGVKHLAIVVRQVDPDLLLLPNGDRLLTRFALHTPAWVRAPVRGLVMADPRNGVSGSLLFRAKSYAKIRLLELADNKPMVTCCWLSGPACSEFSQPSCACSVPDPVLLETSQSDLAFGESLPLSADRYWFALVGVIDRWKNPLMVVRAFKALKARGDAVGLVVCGPIRGEAAHEVRRELHELAEAGDAILVDRVLTNGEMNEVVRRSDAVVLAYSTHATTSTLGKAASLGTQIVAVGSSGFVRHALSVQASAFTGSLDVDSLTNLMGGATRAAPPIKVRLAGPREFACALLGAEV